jgi:hypothetical protein
VKFFEYFYNFNLYKFAQLARGLEVQTSVVRVYGLGLTLHASVRLYIYIYVYMILHGYVKQYKYKTM